MRGISIATLAFAAVAHAAPFAEGSTETVQERQFLPGPGGPVPSWTILPPIGGTITPGTPTDPEEGEKRDVVVGERSPPVFTILPPITGPIIPDPHYPGGPIKPSDKRNEKRDIIIDDLPEPYPTKSEPTKSEPTKYPTKTTTTKPETTKTTFTTKTTKTTKYPTKSETTKEPTKTPTPYPTKPEPTKPPIFTILPPITGPIIPDEPVPGGPIIIGGN